MTSTILNDQLIEIYDKNLYEICSNYLPINPHPPSLVACDLPLNLS